MSLPGKRLIRFESAVDDNRLDRRAHIARAVNGKGVAKIDVHFPEVKRMLEKRALRLRSCNFRPALTPRAQLRRALTLLAVMMGEQHPLDTSDADLIEMIEHTAVAQID